MNVGISLLSFMILASFFSSIPFLGFYFLFYFISISPSSDSFHLTLPSLRTLPTPAGPLFLPFYTVLLRPGGATTVVLAT